MKIELNSDKINPFSGINFVIDEIRRLGIDSLIDRVLGARSKNSEYTYSDIIKTIWSIILCGGDCAEDIEANLGAQLTGVPGLNIPGADTILRGQKELMKEKEFTVSSKGLIHELAINADMNRLAIQMQKKLGLLKKEKAYTLDFDHQLLPCEKKDSDISYKKIEGYFPGVCIINGMPVYIENRSGNTNVKYLQEETLKRAFDLFMQEKINIEFCRMDCGSYAKAVIDIIEKNSKSFYVRAQKCENMEEQIHLISAWSTKKIGKKYYEVASIKYYPFGQKEKSYRLVIMREPNSTGEMNLFTQDSMIYRSILTNDWKKSEKTIIEFYNARGSAEKVFDVMNNDFGWNRLPFSYMDENLVYLIITGMCQSLYKYLITKYSKKFSFLESNFRIKKFIFRFIVVAGKWIRRGRQNILKLYTDKPYQLALE